MSIDIIVDGGVATSLDATITGVVSSSATTSTATDFTPLFLLGGM